jgi:hypothetical protein
VKKIKKIKISARQGEFILEKNPHVPNPTSATDDKSGGCKESEVIDDKDNCGAAGMQQLNILPTKCKAFVFDMDIFMASIFVYNEVGKLATKYQAWHKQTANKNQSAGRPASQITTGCAHIYLVEMHNNI